LTLSGLNVLGIENKFPKVIVQIFDIQNFVLIFYEKDFGFSQERSLFDQLEFEISGQQIFKNNICYFLNHLEFQIFLQDSYFLPLNYFNSYLVNDYISHLSKSQQRIIHKYC
jgi:hypothetical protein